MPWAIPFPFGIVGGWPSAQTYPPLSPAILNLVCSWRLPFFREGEQPERLFYGLGHFSGVLVAANDFYVLP